MQADTPMLRQKYYEMLDSSLNTAAEPAVPDNSALLWQGLLPTLGVALATGGKSFGASGKAVGDVLTREQKRADDNQNFSVNAKLKSAGLLGEELTKRENLQATREERAESRRVQQSQFDERIAETRESRRVSDENADATRAQIGALGQIAAGQRAESGKDRDAKAAFSETNTVIDDYEKEAKPIKEAATQLRQMDRLIDTINDNPENAKAATGMLAGLSIQISQGGGRVSDKDIALVGGSSADATLNKWKNWMDGGARGTMPEMTPEAIRVATSALSKPIYEQYDRIEKKYKTRTGMMEFGNKEKVGQYLSEANPFPERAAENTADLPPDTTFQTKAGARTLAQLRAVPGWNDSMISQLQGAK